MRMSDWSSDVCSSDLHLHNKCLSARPGEEISLDADQYVTVVDDEAVAVVLGAVDTAKLDVTDEDAYAVLDGLLATSATSAPSDPALSPRSQRKVTPRTRRSVVYLGHQRREVVQDMNDCSHGTLEVADS